MPAGPPPSRASRPAATAKAHPATSLGFETCPLTFLAPGSQCPPPTPSPIPYLWDPGAESSPSSPEAAPGADLRAFPPELWASALSVPLTPDPLASWVFRSPSNAD